MNSMKTNQEKQGITVMSGLIRLLLLCGLIFFSGVSQATHEVDHRYRIFGTVQNSDGTPVVNTKVKLTGFGGRPLGETNTDKVGGYEFRLHVHNQDLGTRFWVTANGMTGEGRISFDPGNKNTERVHRVDLPNSD
jgi:hypothetical protein